MRQLYALVMLLTVLSQGFCASAMPRIGQTVEITVTADGTQPFSYQWSKDGSDIAGATESQLILGSVKASDAGNYAVKVSNSAGSTKSASAVITIAPMMATLTANVTSANYPAPALYQWRLNGQSIRGANQPTYSFDPVAAPGSYTLQVTWPNVAPATVSAAITAASP